VLVGVRANGVCSFVCGSGRCLGQASENEKGRFARTKRAELGQRKNTLVSWEKEKKVVCCKARGGEGFIPRARCRSGCVNKPWDNARGRVGGRPVFPLRSVLG